jgi:hypothetical protein
MLPYHNTDEPITSAKGDPLLEVYLAHIANINDTLKHIHFSRESQKRLKRIEYYRVAPWYKQLFTPVPNELKANEFPVILTPTLGDFESWKRRRVEDE